MAVRLYCDASVFTALVLGDATAPEILVALDVNGSERIYSDLGWGELIAAIGRQVRLGRLRSKAGGVAIDRARLVLQDWSSVETMSTDIIQATLWLSDLTLALKLPDAIHIAVACRLGATLISTDRQQVTAARKLGLPCINPIEDIS